MCRNAPKDILSKVDISNIRLRCLVFFFAFFIASMLPKVLTWGEFEMGISGPLAPALGNGLRAHLDSFICKISIESN